MLKRLTSKANLEHKTGMAQPSRFFAAFIDTKMGMESIPTFLYSAPVKISMSILVQSSISSTGTNSKRP